MNKSYIITLDGIRIGTTQLETADPPMGVVMGKIYFENIDSGYQLFHQYCLKSGIQPDEHDPSRKFIQTPSIPELILHKPDGLVIKGLGTYVTGFESDFEITVLGIPYPFYEEEFHQHCRDYKGRTGNKDY